MSNNQPALDAIVPLTSSGQVVSNRRDMWQRVGRTLLQLLISGGFTAIIDLLAADLPDRLVPYLYAVVMLATVTAQNSLESAGKIPAILKRPSVQA